MKLFIAEADKANHYLYGTIIGVIAVALGLLFGFPSASPFLAPVTATIIGVLEEVRQYLENRAYAKRGLPAQRSVESMDAVATALGGLVVGIGAYLQQVLS